jgi:hypothetical protein
MELQTPLYDGGGNLLLAKHQVIDTPSLLSALREHPALFTDEQSLRETARAVMSSFEEASRLDMPLGEMQTRPVSNASGSGPVAAAQAQAAEQRQRSLPECWTDLEVRLGGSLASLALEGGAAREALKRMAAAETELNRLMSQDTPGSLYLLFNRSVRGFNGYSALHALVCAAVAWDASQRLPINADEKRSLVMAALTMNLSIKLLQDLMAGQKTRATHEQLNAIANHSSESARLLRQAGVTDALWLATVERHHDDLPSGTDIAQWPAAQKLAKILQVIDRYTAAMSPRGSRPGREPREAARSVIRTHGSKEHDQVGLDLMQNLGLYPPGTYVELVRGDVAVVVKSSRRPNEPWVATVVNRHGEPVLEPRVSTTQDELTMVKGGVAGSAVKVRVNEALMLRHIATIRASIGLA